MTYPIPDDALDERHAFVGTSGSGKTNAAASAAERLLRCGVRVVVIDPLDVWYGLRLRCDGVTPSEFPVVIFGGAHGDLPLNEHAGALLGETIATTSESCIVSLGERRGRPERLNPWSSVNRKRQHRPIYEADKLLWERGA